MPVKNKSPKMTETLAAYVKWLWNETPLNQAQIAFVLGAISQGRVSEVINGLRFEDVAPAEFVGWRHNV